MNKPKYSILYVDDEKNNLLIFKDTFRRNYNVFTATSAKDGSEILKKEKIDIILSDQRMPEVTGVDFFKQTLKEYPNINRILITGYTDFKAIKTAINDAKIYQYVQKPWQEDDLNATIQEALKIYELENENKKLITDLKKAYEKIKIEKEKAEESNILKSVFLSNLSHEIRTPMNGIIGFSSLLKNKELSEKKRLEYVDIIVRSSEQLLKIIDDIVEISKLHTKQIKVKETKFDITVFFDDIYKISKTLLNNKNISLNIEKHIPKNKNIIIADKTKLHKITSNLVENALRYTKEGFIKISYTISNKKLIVEIADSGIGIEENMHNEIFERFRQGNESISRNFGGLGLGLSIVKENLEILGGKINVKSKKGKGSSFRFEIPIKLPKPNAK